MTVISPNPAHLDIDHAICDLVAHIRRCRPDVVITSGPCDGGSDVDRMAIGQQATATDLFDGLRRTRTLLAMAA